MEFSEDIVCKISPSCLKNSVSNFYNGTQEAPIKGAFVFSFEQRESL